jgi:hypothetical protein
MLGSSLKLHVVSRSIPTKFQLAIKGNIQDDV